jgi:hypothetical protein
VGLKIESDGGSPASISGVYTSKNLFLGFKSGWDIIESPGDADNFEDDDYSAVP